MSVKPRTTKAQRRRKRTIRVVSALVIVAAALIVGVLYLRHQVQTEFSTQSQTDVLTGQVTVGSIRTTVSGSGQLVSEDLTDITCPMGVAIQELLVEEGDAVTAGQPLARVTEVSVLSALSDVQSQLEELDSQLKSAGSDTVSTQVKTAVAGRLKAIFAQKGESVAAVMHRDGALALLSLDGYMAAQFESQEYVPGDTVSIVASDGKTYSGSVSQVQSGVVTVLLTDNGPAYQDTVTIDERYTAQLEIHQPFKVTGYAGTVSYVNSQVNSQLYAGSILMGLTDTSYSANYNRILEERQELEEVLQELIGLYQTGVITASVDGAVDNIPTEEAAASPVPSDADTDYTQTQTILTIDPEETMSVTISVDETDILSLQTGQQVSVTVESVGTQTYTGTLTKIDTTATSGSGVTYYSAQITLPRAPGMMAGMTATASVTIQGVENALLLPEDAVQKTSSSSYVYTSQDPETGELGGMTEVTTGLSNGTYIEITAGLQEGDTVYYTQKTQQTTTPGFTGNRNTGSGMSGGNMPGGNMPGGNMPGGNTPGGNTSGSGRPSGSNGSPRG